MSTPSIKVQERQWWLCPQWLTTNRIVFVSPSEDLSGNQRRLAKTIGFSRKVAISGRTEDRRKPAGGEIPPYDRLGSHPNSGKPGCDRKGNRFSRGRRPGFSPSFPTRHGASVASMSVRDRLPFGLSSGLWRPGRLPDRDHQTDPEPV